MPINDGGATVNPSTPSVQQHRNQAGGMQFQPRSINQVDVRTPEMHALEQAMLPLVTSILGNPQGMMEMFGGIGGGVPGLASFDQNNPAATGGFTGGLSDFLFNNAGGGDPFGGNPGVDITGKPPTTSNVGGSVTGSGGQGVDITNKPPTTSNVGGHVTVGNIPPNMAPGTSTSSPGPSAGTGLAPGTTPGLDQGVLDQLNQIIYGGPQGMQQFQENFLTAPTSGRDSHLETGLSNALTQAFLNPRSIENMGVDALHNLPRLGTGEIDPRFTEMINAFQSGSLEPDAAQQLAGGALSTLSGFSMDQLPGLFDILAGVLNGGINSAAQGGILDPNTPTLVGERGPELIANGQIIPLEGLQTAADGGVFDPTLLNPNQTNNSGNFSSTNQPAGLLQQQLLQNPEVDIFNQAQNDMSGILGGANPGQGVVDALQPVFQQNLDSSLASLQNMSPSTFNSGIQAQGGDIAQRSLNDFNLFASQALQQGVNQQQQGMSILGQLAGQAGQNPFNRALNAGQLATQRDLGFGQLAQNQQQFNSNFGLQAQNQAFQQQVMPSLQLLMAALGMSQPTGLQTVAVGG